MDEATIALTVMTAAIGISFLGFLIWGIRSGQFHNIEEAKFQVFRKQKQRGEEQKNMNKDKKEEVKPDAKP